jgi:hypothetical protein
MFVRVQLGVAVALLMVAGANARADSYKPSVESIRPNPGLAPAPSGYATSASPIDLPSGPDAYNRSATTDPYNQPDFSAPQTFGLTASQMLGAAAACEQLHSDLVSGQRARASKDPSDEDRANLDAAQDHLLDPAATPANALRSGEVDCDRVSGAFNQLQQIQIRDQDLAKALDQPDAVNPVLNRAGKGNKNDLSR